ncbi:MAG: small basic protein [Planctomycetia bacterium]|jgi:small basic protein (TIGR04137 family)|nr:small basic protein [Planctomycetia bacterium]MCC7315169.1 small basic protein [Planctomycetota bacterium]
MSMDRSLKSKASLARHRNVLTRAERIERLRNEERFPEGRSATGLPKVANRKAPIGGKTKKGPAKEGEAEAAAPAAAAPAKKSAAPAKK